MPGGIQGGEKRFNWLVKIMNLWRKKKDKTEGMLLTFYLRGGHWKGKIENRKRLGRIQSLVGGGKRMKRVRSEGILFPHGGEDPKKGDNLPGKASRKGQRTLIKGEKRGQFMKKGEK